MKGEVKNAGNVVPSVGERMASQQAPSDVSKTRLPEAKAIGGKAATTMGYKPFKPGN